MFFDTLSKRFICIQLHYTYLMPHDTFSPNAQYHIFWIQHLWVVCKHYLHKVCGRPTAIFYPALLDHCIISHSGHTESNQRKFKKETIYIAFLSVVSIKPWYYCDFNICISCLFILRPSLFRCFN